MDLKGITWVGDVYQKFEAMCLEVEETMYEDTVKYVENQVQTVGASMKKFYADVMQDILPPASEGSAKGTISDGSVELHTDLGVYLKPKMSMTDIHDKDSWNIASVRRPDLSSAFLCHVDNLFPLAQGDAARGALEKYSKGSLSKKSNLGIRKCYRREKTCQNEVSELAFPLPKSLARRRSTMNHEASFDQQARVATSGSGHISLHDHKEESKAETVEPKASVPTCSTADILYDRAVPLELGSSEQLDARLSSNDNSLAESNGNYVSEDLSSAKPSERSGKFAYIEDYTTGSERPSDWDIDMIMDDDDGSTDLERDTDGQSNHAMLEDGPVEVNDQQQVDQVLLEDSCVVVSEDEFDFVSHSEGKRPSYKKRFRDVFSSRRRSLRKQQQDKLADPKPVDTPSGQEKCSKSSSSAFPGAGVAELCDPEWELV